MSSPNTICEGDFDLGLPIGQIAEDVLIMGPGDDPDEEFVNDLERLGMTALLARLPQYRNDDDLIAELEQQLDPADLNRLWVKLTELTRRHTRLDMRHRQLAGSVSELGTARERLASELKRLEFTLGDALRLLKADLARRLDRHDLDLGAHRRCLEELAARSDAHYDQLGRLNARQGRSLLYLTRQVQASRELKERLGAAERGAAAAEQQLAEMRQELVRMRTAHQSSDRRSLDRIRDLERELVRLEATLAAARAQQARDACRLGDLAQDLTGVENRVADLDLQVESARDEVASLGSVISVDYAIVDPDEDSIDTQPGLRAVREPQVPARRHRRFMPRVTPRRAAFAAGSAAAAALLLLAFFISLGKDNHANAEGQAVARDDLERYEPDQGRHDPIVSARPSPNPEPAESKTLVVDSAHKIDQSAADPAAPKRTTCDYGPPSVPDQFGTVWIECRNCPDGGDYRCRFGPEWIDQSGMFISGACEPL